MQINQVFAMQGWVIHRVWPNMSGTPEKTKELCTASYCAVGNNSQYLRDVRVKSAVEN